MAEAGRPDIVLASASASRRRLLEAAGLPFRPVPADIDEAAHKRHLLNAQPDCSASNIADSLARAKALSISRRLPEVLVIGADQVLALDGKLFDKPPDPAAARQHLRSLRGRRHELHTAVALALAGEVVWTKVDVASLVMRCFSDEYLERYLVEAGPSIYSSVGAYELEGRGIQLFERVDGNYFSILGLPLLALLAQLRARGALAT